MHKYNEVKPILEAYSLYKQGNIIGYYMLMDMKESYPDFVDHLLKEDGEGGGPAVSSGGIANVAANIGVDVDLEATTGISAGYRKDNLKVNKRK